MFALLSNDRLVGPEQNETPSLEDLAKAPQNKISQTLKGAIQRRNTESDTIDGVAASLAVFASRNETIPRRQRDVSRGKRMHSKIRRALVDKTA